jgi:adenosine kinase
MKYKPHKRLVIFTRGADSTIVTIGDQFVKYPTPKVPKEEIVDTNGAGDSFVGGFLAAYAMNKPIGDCIRFGQYVAIDCLRHLGATFSDKPSITLQSPQ